jgi:hypothetical protein
MSVRSKKSAADKRISPAAIVVAVVVLIVFVSWRAWVAFAPVAEGPLPPAPTQDINYLKQKAIDCQGDFNKLSAEDQAKVAQISHGFGPAAMASNWRKHNKPQ